MSNKQAVVLRMPRWRAGERGYSTRAVDGAWVNSVKGWARALAALQRPEAIERLEGLAGGEALWDPGSELAAAPWSERPWPAGGWVSEEGWRAASLAGFDRGWTDQAGRRRAMEWDEGGWAWSAEDGCWMTQTFTLAGSKEGAPARAAALSLQPGPLTVWQWDRDPFDENRQFELSEADLLAMARGMRARALGRLIDGLHGAYEPRAGAIGQLEAMREAALIEEGLAPGADAAGRSGRL